MIVRRDSVEPIEFSGLQIRDYTAKNDAEASFAVIEVPPTTKHPEAYSKRSDKYYYVQSGRILFTLDGNILNLSAGDLCLVYRGHHFSYENGTQDPATMILFHSPSFALGSEVFIED